MIMKLKQMTTNALLTAIALTIFMIEAQIPTLVPIPGVKLGLANIITVFALFALNGNMHILFQAQANTYSFLLRRNTHVLFPFQSP